MAPLDWPSYDSYQDSGFEWLDAIPAGWIVKRLKHVTRQVSDKVSSADISLPYIGMENVESWSGRLVEGGSEVEGLAAKFSAGDVIFGKLRPYLAKAAKLEFPGMCSTEFIVFRTTPGLEPDFLAYLLRSAQFVSFVDSSTYGSKMPRANPSFIANCPVGLPPPQEQRVIAAFLDEKCAKVDEAVRIKEEQIALLRERRQILIQEAVTRGLNPDAPMKDSGIEWIRKIPSHWTVKKLKNLCRFSGGSTPSKERVDYWEDGTVPWVSPKDMKQSYIAETQDRMTEKAVRESAVSFVHQGSLLIVVRSGILQRTIPVAINSVPVTLNQDMKALTFGTSLLAKYMMFLIEGNSGALLPILTKEGATVESIEQSNLANCYVPVPPPSEQKAIVAHIENSNQKLDCAIKIKEEQIATLKEYKTTLINAAVTGKIKVA